ncbi:MAG: response regulator [Planctomycetota bacterium]|jgi:DNA-binding NtrC family response regulator
MSLRALVVDDHRDVAEFVAEALHDLEAMDVDVATSKEEAEELAKENDYGLFVVDVYLRGFDNAPDGLFFVKALQREDPRAKVILMTGRSYSKIITDVVIRTGSTHLLGKPIDINVLLETVHKVLEETP